MSCFYKFICFMCIMECMPLFHRIDFETNKIKQKQCNEPLLLEACNLQPPASQCTDKPVGLPFSGIAIQVGSSGLPSTRWLSVMDPPAMHVIGNASAVWNVPMALYCNFHGPCIIVFSPIIGFFEEFVNRLCSPLYRAYV